MSTERELLELAAKAAGYDVRWVETYDALLRGSQPRPYLVPDWPKNRRKRVTDWKLWMPNFDVGDATRLLLALKLRVDYVGDQPCIEGVLQSGMTAEESFCRAVVRAAAAIEKEMKE